MPYYRSKKENNVSFKFKNRNLVITKEPCFHKEPNLHILFPTHIDIISDFATELINKKVNEIMDAKMEGIKYLSNILPTNSWGGERCFIIGGGPSLEGFNFDLLKGERIIAVNKAIVNTPFADIMFCEDKRFYNWLKDPTDMPTLRETKKVFEEFQGIKVWTKMVGEIYSNDIYLINALGDLGVSKKLENGIYHGSNSGYGALNLAIALGANPIYLLGFDFKHRESDGKPHYHDGYPTKQILFGLKLFIKKFPTIAGYTEKNNIKVFNLSTDSDLKCFPFEKIENLNLNNKPSMINFNITDNNKKFYIIGENFKETEIPDDGNIIVLNNAYLKIPNANIIFSSDFQNTKIYDYQFRNHPAKKIAFVQKNKNLLPKFISLIKALPYSTFGNDKNIGLGYPKNELYSAINLASILGAKTISLLGVDSYINTSNDEIFFKLKNYLNFRKIRIGIDLENNAIFNSAISMNIRPTGHKKYLNDVLPGDSWKNQECFIIGGGPSLKDFDFNQLKRGRIIAINKAFQKLPWADILFSMDSRFYLWLKKNSMGESLTSDFIKFKGLKVWLDTHNYPFDYNEIYLVPCLGEKGFSFNLKDGIYGGKNSGYAALNLAVALGANPIYLMGYDMKHEDGKTHWHNGYPLPQKVQDLNSYALHFENIAGLIKNKGIKVINLNRNSALQCFEFGDWPPPQIETISNKFIIVCYYTKDTEYEKDMLNLKKSLDLFHLEYDLVGIPKNEHADLTGPDKFKNWNINSYRKAEFIRKMMDKYPSKSIIWIDADATVHQYPFLFENIQEDMAVHYRSEKELLSGTLFFKNNKKARLILDRWIEKNNESKNFLIKEQRHLQTVLDELKDSVSVYRLPANYTQIFDIMKNCGDPVILHHQASRRYRR